MITAKLLTYRYNDLTNAKPGVKRNNFVIKDIVAEDGKPLRAAIEMELDGIPPGKGYVLVKWNGRMFLCQKDANTPEVSYVRHEVTYHPLSSKLN